MGSVVDNGCVVVCALSKTGIRVFLVLWTLPLCLYGRTSDDEPRRGGM